MPGSVVKLKDTGCIQDIGCWSCLAPILVTVVRHLLSWGHHSRTAARRQRSSSSSIGSSVGWIWICMTNYSKVQPQAIDDGVVMKDTVVWIQDLGCWYCFVWHQAGGTRGSRGTIKTQDGSGNVCRSFEQRTGAKEKSASRSCPHTKQAKIKVFTNWSHRLLRPDDGPSSSL